jgi:HEAT repeat protein
MRGGSPNRASETFPMPRGKLASVLIGLAAGLWLWHSSNLDIQAEEPGEADAQLLKSQGIASDGPALLEFFRQRSLKSSDRRRLEELVRQLSSDNYRDRETASRLLITRGSAALPVLKQAQASQQGGLEGARRIALCIQKIESGPGPELPVAAARLLALRQPAGAVEVLLEYLAGADDDWTREEGLASLGRLALHQGTVDPVLTAALKAAAPARRATAAEVLGQRGGVAWRAAVRGLLADPDASVRRAAAHGLVGPRSEGTGAESLAADEALLKANGVAGSEAGLLEFLRRRTLAESDEQQVRQLVQLLGASAHRVRDDASRKLAVRGTPALPFLEQALGSTDLETARRARLCIEAIQSGPGPALPAAAVRLLARAGEARQANPTTGSPGPALLALLNYVPFADDASVEEEVVNALTVLSVREARVDPVLIAALHDRLPARRAAAAYVLGRVGTGEHCQAVRKLLGDPAPSVRVRAVQGLVAARDRTAVPHLIALLTDGPQASLWQVEELLNRLGGDQAPSVHLGDRSPGARHAAAAAWTDWWRERGSALDLAHVDLQDRRLGLTLICEYDSMVAGGRPGGQVWECGRDRKARWKITGLLGPMDAQVLRGGRVLVAENSGQRVTERDLAGAIKWQHPVNGNPIACQRLPNGNTFIATYNQVLEVTPTHQIVYAHNHGPGFYLFSAQKLKSGHIVCMTAQGRILELDSATGRELKNLNMGQAGWCGAKALPGGRFLVAVMAQGLVREVDGNGKVSADWHYPGAFRANRLPNGHTLVASMTTRKVAELDRSGRPVWEHVCEGRPWQVRWR